ncbi:P-type ATPase [Pseudonocardia abyssalis]|uniref:P-type ATPase n=1 Tax=Pseudonocardia abyssalis TaxID=2792008 RepID=UPI003556558E
MPDQATVLRDGAEVVAAPAAIRVGDLMLVLPGERLATDGRITGRPALDLSAITGESVPVEAGPVRRCGQRLGAQEVRVTSTAEDNSLTGIVEVPRRRPDVFDDEAIQVGVGGLELAR